jgi:2-oxoglutarate ferredoxin oxidoreductase subunit alpha
MERRINRLNWLIGGAQGSGVDSAANMFAKACAFGGLHVYGQREYYSNIMGEHSYFQLRVYDQPRSASSDRTHLLVSFDAETVFLHGRGVIPGAGIIYDPKLAQTPLERLPTLENNKRRELAEYLAENGKEETLGDFLQLQSDRGVLLFPIPYDEILNNLAEESGLALSKLKRATNTMAVAASCSLLGYGMEWLGKALEDVFGGKQKIIDLNIRVSEMVYEHMSNLFDGEFICQLEPVPNDEKRIYVNGNQAVAMGKILAGCTLQSYYPISPATDESTYLEAHELFNLNGSHNGEQSAIVVVQMEDEIAAVNAANGAALAGARAATATSGPGFCLMIEGLGFAGINEIPIVITLYQRGSPSTGLPTRGEQGDLWFAVFAGHGESPRIVLASGGLQESFYDAIDAFNYAEEYQLPVVHLMDKALASGSQTFPDFDTSNVKIKRGKLLTEDELSKLTEDGAYKSFAYSDDGISPRSVYGMKGGIFWKTSDEHDEWGHITEDPEVRVKMMDKRMSKFDTILREIPSDKRFTVHGDPDAETVIVSWGSTKGAILEAIEMLAEEGIKIKFIQARMIWPFSQEITAHLDGAKVKIGIENNFSGQFAKLVRQETGIVMDNLIVKYNGRPMSVDEVYDSIKSILSQEAPEKVVLTRGA